MKMSWYAPLLFAALPAFAAEPVTDLAADTTAGPGDANAVTQEDEAEDPDWSTATGTWGSRGLYRIDAARSVKPGSLIFTLSSEFSYSNGLFQPGDSDLLSVERLYVLWSPVKGLDLALSEALKINNWDTFVPAKLQVLGQQRLHVKYARKITDTWAVGGRLQWQLPTAVYSAGAVPRASVVHLDALATRQLPHRIALSANIGFIYDHSRSLAGRDLQPDKRLVYEVNDGSALSLGVGAGIDVPLRRRLVLAPFAELSARINAFDGGGPNPSVATVGAKIFGADAHTIEFALGLDVRMSGAPQPDAGFAGLPPWVVFAVLSLHIFDHPPQSVLLATPCDTNTDCPGGQLCVAHLCRYTTEVIKETIKRVKQDTFTVSGTVTDSETGRPVEDASVTFHGFEHAPVMVNVKTGRFASFPLDSGEGLIELKVSAPDYKPFVTAVQRGKPNAIIATDVHLSRSDRPDFGVVQGAALDSKTGAPLRDARIFIPALQQTIAAGDKGRFDGKVKVGKYDILISAHGYITQRKHIVVHDGDTLILNVDLARDPRRRHGRSEP